MNVELVKQLLIIGIASGIISTALTQKIKEQLKSTKYLWLISLIASFFIGIAFSLSFTDLSILNAVWVGLFTFIGSDILYQAFEDKIFKSFSTIEEERNKYEVLEIE